MVQYTRAVEGEISGLADVEWDKKQENLVVSNVYLLKQEATTGNVLLLDEAVDNFMLELIQQGASQLPRLWWHSHYDFEPFFSSVDEDTIDRYGKKTTSFWVAICINQKGTMEAKAVFKSPEEKTVESLSIRITPPVPSFEPTEEIKEEVKQKVTMEKPFFGHGSWIDRLIGKEEKEEFPRQVFLLSRNPRKAARMIRKHHLVETFDPELHEWVFEDKSGRIYRKQSSYSFGKGLN
jgi:hypothetical protein